VIEELLGLRIEGIPGEENNPPEEVWVLLF
jgi:hypothetical protein